MSYTDTNNLDDVKQFISDRVYENDNREISELDVHDSLQALAFHQKNRIFIPQPVITVTGGNLPGYLRQADVTETIPPSLSTRTERANINKFSIRLSWNGISHGNNQDFLNYEPHFFMFKKYGKRRVSRNYEKSRHHIPGGGESYKLLQSWIHPPNFKERALFSNWSNILRSNNSPQPEPEDDPGFPWMVTEIPIKKREAGISGGEDLIIDPMDFYDWNGNRFPGAYKNIVENGKLNPYTRTPQLLPMSLLDYQGTGPYPVFNGGIEVRGYKQGRGSSGHRPKTIAIRFAIVLVDPFQKEKDGSKRPLIGPMSETLLIRPRVGLFKGIDINKNSFTSTLIYGFSAKTR